MRERNTWKGGRDRDKAIDATPRKAKQMNNCGFLISTAAHRPKKATWFGKCTERRIPRKAGWYSMRRGCSDVQMNSSQDDEASPSQDDPETRSITISLHQQPCHVLLHTCRDAPAGRNPKVASAQCPVENKFGVDCYCSQLSLSLSLSLFRPVFCWCCIDLCCIDLC